MAGASCLTESVPVGADSKVCGAHAVVCMPGIEDTGKRSDMEPDFEREREIRGLGSKRNDGLLTSSWINWGVAAGCYQELSQLNGRMD